MTGDSAARVLVVDDHDLFRTGLRALLEEEGFEVADARSGEAGVAALDWFTPDVVLMDVNMPGMSGIEATARVLEARPGAAVLMLTVSREPARVIEAIRAGAAGYVLKDAEFEEILAAIRAAAAGQSVLGTSATEAVMAHVRDAPPAAPADALAGLSAREREVLALVASGCDNTVIAERLYVSLSTVKHHVSRILDELGVDNRLQAAALAIRNGLVAAERRGDRA
jgi:DNA-binding NarL/FixJ family response regulator